MTTYFCDTSAIIKLYHPEAGTDQMENIFNDEQSDIIISELTTVEFYSALTKKVRTGEITENSKNEAIRNFQKDCHDRFIVMPLDTRIIRHARNLINRYGSQTSIRTLDALQLASCLEEKTDEMKFVCADLHLNRTSDLEGISAINPESETTSS